MLTRSRTFFLVLGAVAFLTLARSVPASADGTNIVDTIDRIPEGIFDGNPRAWQGVFAPGAQIADDITPPFLFDPPEGTTGWTGGPRTALTRSGQPLQSELSATSAYEVVRANYETTQSGLVQRGTLDEVFVIASNDLATVPFAKAQKIITMFASLRETGATAHTATADRGMLAPIHALTAATLADTPPNPKALAVMLAAYVPQPLIVDDFPPYRFTGFGAVRTWASGFEGIVAHSKIEHLRLHLAAPEFVQRSGMRATLVIPMHVAFTSNGTPSSVDGRWLFVLDRSEGPYRIAASVWAQEQRS